VITTDVPPVSEFVEPEVNGWLVPVARTRRRSDSYYWPEAECDVESLAALMQQCVERRAERPLWRRRARDYAEARLTWRKNSCGLVDEASRILASASTALPARFQQAILRAHPDRRDLVGRLRRRANRQLASLRHRL
jgi:glycosyltransferase involved in cell wall biosynthesis